MRGALVSKKSSVCGGGFLRSQCRISQWNVECWNTANTSTPTTHSETHTRTVLSPLPLSWLSHLCYEKCFSTCVMFSLRALFWYILDTVYRTHIVHQAMCRPYAYSGITLLGQYFSLFGLFTVQVYRITHTHLFEVVLGLLFLPNGTLPFCGIKKQQRAP